MSLARACRTIRLLRATPICRSAVSLHACSNGNHFSTVPSECNLQSSAFVTRPYVFGKANHDDRHRPTTAFSKRFASSLPNHVKVPLPALSPTMEKGNIKSWSKNEGDKLEEGDLLALIETDKATMDFETPQAGYLARIMLPAGAQDVPLGKLLCIIVDNEADVAAFKDFKGDSEPAAAKDAGDSSKKQQVQEGQQQDSKQASPKQKSDPVQEDAASANYPDHTVINLPALSPTVEKSTIKTWEKKEGDKIGEGELIATVETDKATIDWTYEDTESMILAKLIVSAGTADVAVGQPVCIFVRKDADVGAFKNYKTSGSGAGSQKPSSQPKEQKQEADGSRQQQPGSDTKDKQKVAVDKSRAKESSQKPTDADEQTASNTPQRADSDRVFASPYARKLSADRGYDVASISGSGPGGRVVAADVENFEPSKARAAPKPAAAEPPSRPRVPAGERFLDIPLSNMRQIIGKRLLESKQTIPHYTLTVDIEMDDVMRIRQQLNDELKSKGGKLSVNDFIVKAAASACLRVPECNSAWMGQSIRQYSAVDVSIAVSTDGGLITPIVFDADSKGLAQINADIASLSKKAREGKLKPHEFQGGTFTVSNLGMFGIKSFSAVINPPQSCILSTGGVEKRLLPDAKDPDDLDQIRLASVMSVTLNCDHRVVDGAVGAQWLQNFKRFLESPATMLL